MAERSADFGNVHLTVVGDADDLAARCAETIASAIDLALAERDRAQIALAGGETPKATYIRLGQEHLPWDRVDVLLGDERWVPADDPASNARMVRTTLLAQPSAGLARLHPVRTDLATPAEGVLAYASLLRQLCAGDPPCLDLVLLGLGDDGHTASLFPGTAAAAERSNLVTIGEGKGLPRITLTAPVLSAARQVVFLVSGVSKRQALQRLLDPEEPAERTPARLVQPRGRISVLADQDAAADLPL